MGVDIASINHEQGSIDSTVFLEAIVNASVFKPLSDQLSFNADAKFGLLDASGLVVLSGEIDYDFADLLELKLDATYKSTIPSLIRQRLVVNDSLYQESDWDDITGGSLSLSTFYKPTSTSFDVSYEAFTNLFTINQRGFFEQIRNSVSLLSLQTKQDVKVGPVYTEHALKFQTISDNRFTVPRWNYTGSFYVQFHLFKKKMFAQLGTDVYFLPPFDLPEFYAVTGEFYNSSPANGTSVVILNPYFNAKVGPFHIFVKGMDMLHRLRTTAVVPVPGSDATVRVYDFPLVTGLPRQDFKFRFGIKWTFLD